jgi:hypothetical protein
VEDILDKSPLPRYVTAALLIFFTNVVLHPIILVPIFQPSAINYPLYESGVELFYAMLWSAFGAIAIVLLSAYSTRIRFTLDQIGEIFGLETSASRTLSLSLTRFITGTGCLGTGLIIGSIASFVDFQYVMPSMVSHGWYSNAIIHYADVGHTFFTYMLGGSVVWVLATYA